MSSASQGTVFLYHAGPTSTWEKIYASHWRPWTITGVLEWHQRWKANEAALNKKHKAGTHKMKDPSRWPFRCFPKGKESPTEGHCKIKTDAKFVFFYVYFYFVVALEYIERQTEGQKRCYCSLQHQRVAVEPERMLAASDKNWTLSQPPPQCLVKTFLTIFGQVSNFSCLYIELSVVFSMAWEAWNNSCWCHTCKTLRASKPVLTCRQTTRNETVLIRGLRTTS